MLSYDNIIVSAKNGNLFDDLGENEEVIAYLPLAWVGDHLFSYGQHYVAGFCVNCPEAGETVIEDRREVGTTYAFAPPRVFENLLTLDHGAHGRCRIAQAPHVPLFHQSRAQVGREDPEQGVRAGDGAADLHARRRDGVRPAEEPLRAHGHSRRLHGRRGDRSGNLPLLSFDRREPEAALRADRSVGLHHGAAGRRNLCRHGRQAEHRRRREDRRERRGAVQVARRFPGLLQGPGEDRRDQDAGRLGAHRRCGLLRSQDRSPENHRPRQGCRPPEGRHACSRRSTSRTS